MKKKFIPIARDKGSGLQHVYSYFRAITGPLKRLIGTNDPPLVVMNRDGWWEIGIEPKAWDAQGARVLRYLEDPRYLARVDREGVRTIRAVQAYGYFLRKQNLRNASPQQLGIWWQELWKRWDLMNVWGHVPNVSDFEHFMLSKKIERFLNDRCAKAKATITAPEAFAVLAMPTRRFLLQEQDRDFLRLLAHIQQRSATKKLLKKDNLSIDDFARYPAIMKALAAHTKRYDWLQFHYDGPTILDVHYFLSALASSAAQGVVARKELRILEAKEHALRKRQEKIVRALHLSSKERYWLSVARTFLFLKGFRKEIVFEACRNIDPFFREVARRLFISPLQARQITIDEMPTVLRKGNVDAAMLNERYRFSALYVKEGKMDIFMGKRAEAYAHSFIRKKVGRVKEFMGSCAYPGKARGVVRIIEEAADMTKMKKGDILVSPATNPNILSAMKIAAAIITDEGGITCHAAIVSRELKIPCVIGTKIATQALKDGDRVEVDAEAGIVRKIK